MPLLLLLEYSVSSRQRLLIIPTVLILCGVVYLACLGKRGHFLRQGKAHEARLKYQDWLMVNVKVDEQYAEMLQTIKNAEDSLKLAIHANHTNKRTLRNLQIENLYKDLSSSTVGTKEFLDINVAIEDLMHENLSEMRRLENTLTGYYKPNGYEESDRKFFHVPSCEIYDYHDDKSNDSDFWLVGSESGDGSSDSSDDTGSSFSEALTNTPSDLDLEVRIPGVWIQRAGEIINGD